MAIPSSLSTLPFVYVVNLFFHLLWEDILELSLLFLFLSPSPGDHPNPEIKPGSPALYPDSLLPDPPRKPFFFFFTLALSQQKILVSISKLFQNVITSEKFHHGHLSWLVSDFPFQELLHKNQRNSSKMEVRSHHYSCSKHPHLLLISLRLKSGPN